MKLLLRHPVWKSLVYCFGIGFIVTRRDVSNRPEAPSIRKKKFTDGEVADAYLAAYAEWIADQAGIDRPLWTRDKRSLSEPWFSDNARASLLIDTPASFRQRGIFTIPEKVVCLRRGRPA